MAQEWTNGRVPMLDSNGRIPDDFVPQAMLDAEQTVTQGVTDVNAALGALSGHAGRAEAAADRAEAAAAAAVQAHEGAADPHPQYVTESELPDLPDVPDTSGLAPKADVLGVIHHTSASDPRPTGYGAVYWTGPTEPINAQAGDIWRQP